MTAFHFGNVQWGGELELLTNLKILDLDTEIWYNRSTESEVIADA